jgi:hypothetical protein
MIIKHEIKNNHKHPLAGLKEMLLIGQPHYQARKFEVTLRANESEIFGID